MAALLNRIEKEMPKARPEVQWTMNNTLGAIGIHHAGRRQRAIATGEKSHSDSLWRDRPVPRLAGLKGLHAAVCAGMGG